MPKSATREAPSLQPEVLAGQRIRAVIEAMGLEYQQIAKAVGRTPGAVSRWIKGESVPRHDVFKRWRQKFNFPLAAWWLDSDPSRLPDDIRSKIDARYRDQGGIVALYD